MAELDLGRQVVDRGLIDRNGCRVGKVDDLEIDVQLHETASLPAVQSIITGPMALAPEWPPPVRLLAGLFYKLLGVQNLEPLRIPWEKVIMVDSVVYVDIAREDKGLSAVAKAVNERFIRKIPGS